MSDGEVELLVTGNGVVSPDISSYVRLVSSGVRRSR